MGRDVVRSTNKDSSQSIAIDGNSWGWGEMIYLSSTCFEISYIVAEIFFFLSMGHMPRTQPSKEFPIDA